MGEAILVIDDEKPVRELIVGMLGGVRYKTLDAPNGRGGITLTRRERPALILCDGRMPEMDGMSTLDAIRNDEPLSGMRLYS